MDIGNGTVSFNSGYFVDFKNRGPSKFVITSTGATGIGTTTPYLL